MARPTSSLATTRATFGVVVGLYPSTDYTLSFELWHSSGSTLASTLWAKRPFYPTTRQFFTATVELPNSTRLRYFKARHVRVGQADSAFTPTVSARPIDLSQWGGGGMAPAGEGHRRTNTLYHTEGVLKPNVTDNDGTLNLAPMRGWLTGTANGGRVPSTSWTDGAAVTFGQTYDSVPSVTLFPGAGTVYLERRASVWSSSGTFNTTAPQYVDLAAVNVTASGFTPRARLIQRSTALTNRTANFGTSNNLNIVTEATSATIANAPSVTDSYTVHYKWKISGVVDPGTTATATLTVAFDSNSTGAYTERGTVTHVATLTTATTSSSNSNAGKVLSVAGLSTTEELRVRIKSYIVSSPYSSAGIPFTVHAFDNLAGDPSAGVTYVTVTSPNYAAMCPSTTDVITWVTQSVVTG